MTRAPIPINSISQVMQDCIAECGPRFGKLGRKIALVLVAQEYDDECAALLFQTIPDAVKEARAELLRFIVDDALRLTPDQAGFDALFAAASVDRRWLISELIDIVCSVFHMEKRDILSQRRAERLVHARHTGMWLAYEFTASSFPEIGRRFGGRDHTTALYGKYRVDAVVEGAKIDKTDKGPLELAKELEAVPAGVWRTFQVHKTRKEFLRKK